MSDVLLIGNGTSRQGINLPKFSFSGKTIGCNHIYREFIPDAIAAMDRPAIKDLKTERPPCTLVFLRRNGPKFDLIVDGYQVLTFDRWDWCSGKLAAWYACAYWFPDRLYMLGVDLGGPNMFHDRSSTFPSASLANWNHLIDAFPDTDFAMVVHEEPNANQRKVKCRKITFAQMREETCSKFIVSDGGTDTAPTT